MNPKVPNDKCTTGQSKLSDQPVRVLWSDYIDAEVAKGLADIEAGNIVAWDPEKIKRLARDASNRKRQ